MAVLLYRSKFLLFSLLDHFLIVLPHCLFSFVEYLLHQLCVLLFVYEYIVLSVVCMYECLVQLGWLMVLGWSRTMQEAQWLPCAWERSREKLSHRGGIVKQTCSVSALRMKSSGPAAGPANVFAASHLPPSYNMLLLNFCSYGDESWTACFES